MKKQIISFIIIFHLLPGLYLNCFAQNAVSKNTLQRVAAIEKNTAYSDADKLAHFYQLKDSLERKNFSKDSGYATVLFKIGIYEADLNNNYSATIQYINTALQTNIAARTKGSRYNILKYYFNVAQFYRIAGLTNKALVYYDSTIDFSKSFADTTYFPMFSKYRKALLYFETGDYQKAAEQSIDGMQYSLQKEDSSYYVGFLNQEAQALCFSGNYGEAMIQAAKANTEALRQGDFFELATALKTQAFIAQRTGYFRRADSLFKEAIQARKQTKFTGQVATDYNDYANFYLDSLNDFNHAKKYYQQSLLYGKTLKDSIVLARATINIGEIYFEQRNYTTALSYSSAALNYLGIPVHPNRLLPPGTDKLDAIAFKELALVIMRNRMESLLALFTSSQKQEYLSACLQTAMVTDSFLTNMRHTQTGSESKLFWRHKTTAFYENAIHACFLANKPSLAFYFMEKSRAVLLNDKLNELNASSYLSKADADWQDDYELKIIELQQKMGSLPATSNQYQTLQLQLLNIKNNYEQFIKSLEQKYPVYYQYKYADRVPAITALQSYLAKNQQCFIDYYFGDSATFILAISATKTSFIRLSNNEFNKDELADFLELCSDKEKLNNHYHSFAALSYSIYKKIFQPLHLPAGRVVICTEKTIIPFEALCNDTTGRNFLLTDYSFDYVYSASFLLKQFNTATAKGNFVGFAPVSFQKYLGVQSLKNAATALTASAAFYSGDKLFTNQSASRKNFFTYAGNYAVINIFSHARADTTGNEPVLYMQDSLIYLSELQLLNHPATQLALLSACQTNVGRLATGEGIFSLARGFATAGIPSVSATLWKADEQAIYAITENFNRYLSQGMNKDEALQKAKLDFLKTHNKEKMLPYYWANMILIGNTDALHLSATHSYFYLWVIGGSIILIVAAFTLRKKFQKNKYSTRKVK
jgi:CHAT domain-containing protein/tetratricopeptide (TPR) repeat protein